MEQRAEPPARLREILNFAQLRALFGHFSVVTGLEVALFDAAGKELLFNRKPDSICAAAANCHICREQLAYGGVMSKELGEPYIYICGCGLIMCSSPVMLNSRLIGSIACGPAILWEADEIACAEVAERTKSMGIATRAGEYLSRTPSCECVNITSAAQILFILVNSLTREHSVYLNQRARITEQQARIAELIHEQKIAAAGLLEMERQASVLAYPYETEKELIAFVQSGNKPQATKILNRLLGVIFSFAEGNLDTIRVKLFELVAFLSRAAVDAGAPLREVNSITKASFELCEDSTDFERLCFLTTEAMERFIDTVYRHRIRKTASPHLTRARAYIAAHFSEDLTLSLVAAKTFVSEFYLSHLFRKEMNTTFSDYVCRVRVDQAKELLKGDPAARIQEIAEKAGFNDPNYFARIFKKKTGASPREYQAFFKTPF